MSAVTFSRVAGMLFALVALAHAYRLIIFFPIQIGSFSVPQAASWAGLLIAGVLSFLGLRARA
jgi:hypothetical protein